MAHSLESLPGRPDQASLWPGRTNGHSRDLAKLLGLRTLEVEEGRVVVGLMPNDAHCSATGLVHGAIPAALLESAAACAVQTTLPAGCHYRTMDLAINVVRLVGVDSRLLCCEAKVLDRSSRLATVEGRVWADPGQRLVAHGKVTCIIDSQ